MTKSVSKFTFDTEFRPEGDLVSNAARARQRRTMTTEEIDNMCARARAEGAKAGQVRATEAVVQAIAALDASLRAVLDNSHAEIEAMRADAVALGFAAARKIATAALDSLPAGDVELALREAMHQAIGEPRLTLRASAKVVEALQDKIAGIAAQEGYDGRVLIHADPNIQGADCRIEWRGGGAERSEAAIMAALDALIQKRFSQQDQQDSKG
jgi:flagellar assembly protein FliH